MSAAQEAVLYAALNSNGRVVYSHESRENVAMNCGYIKTATRVVGLAPIAPQVAAGSVDTTEFRLLVAVASYDMTPATIGNLIANIHVWGAQQREAGRVEQTALLKECLDRGQEEFNRKWTEQKEHAEFAQKQWDNWVSSANDWKERAEKAETRVKELEAEDLSMHRKRAAEPLRPDQSIMDNGAALSILQVAQAQLEALGVHCRLAPMSLPQGVCVSLHMAATQHLAIAADVASMIGGQHANASVSAVDFTMQVTDAAADTAIDKAAGHPG